MFRGCTAMADTREKGKDQDTREKIKTRERDMTGDWVRLIRCDEW